MDISYNYDTYILKKVKEEPDDNQQSCAIDISDTILKCLTPQEYHYKEELDINWEESDNNYDNHTALNELIDKNDITNTIEKVSITAPQKVTLLKRNWAEFKNPDTEKDCPKCKKRLKNLNTLKKHFFYCQKDPYLQCNSCSYKAKYKNALITHIRRTHPEQIPNYKRKRIADKKNKQNRKKGSTTGKENKQSKFLRFCEPCNLTTDSSNSNNCQNCARQLLYKCAKCNKSFESREKLTRHRIDICDPKGYYHCPACDYKATIKQLVKAHLKVHLTPGSHLDTEEIKWKKKEGNVDATETCVFTCPSCNKQFPRIASLASHMRFCVKSQGTTKPPKSYIKKVISVHRKFIIEYCKKCDRNDESSLQNKKYKHTCSLCASAMSFKCIKCGQLYERYPSIYHHVKSICNPESQYFCIICNYKTFDKANLKMHLQYKHDSMIAECPKCKREFRNREHLRQHSYSCGRESFKCNYCTSKYRRRYQLKSHELEKHKDQINI